MFALLQREIERREERIRKLELQLRGAYSGINRALRSSGRGLRDSLRSDTDDFSELGEDQNIFELHVTEAQVYVSQAGHGDTCGVAAVFRCHSRPCRQARCIAPHPRTLLWWVTIFVASAKPF